MSMMASKILKFVDFTHTKKNHTHVKKVGHNSEFLLAFIDELKKQIFIKKTVEVDNKNKIILIFTMLHFLKKYKEKHL